MASRRRYSATQLPDEPSPPRDLDSTLSGSDNAAALSALIASNNDDDDYDDPFASSMQAQPTAGDLLPSSTSAFFDQLGDSADADGLFSTLVNQLASTIRGAGPDGTGEDFANVAAAFQDAQQASSSNSKPNRLQAAAEQTRNIIRQTTEQMMMNEDGEIGGGGGAPSSSRVEAIDFPRRLKDIFSSTVWPEIQQLQQQHGFAEDEAKQMWLDFGRVFAAEINEPVSTRGARMGRRLSSGGGGRRLSATNSEISDGQSTQSSRATGSTALLGGSLAATNRVSGDHEEDQNSESNSDDEEDKKSQLQRRRSIDIVKQLERWREVVITWRSLTDLALLSGIHVDGVAPPLLQPQMQQTAFTFTDALRWISSDKNLAARDPHAKLKIRMRASGCRTLTSRTIDSLFSVFRRFDEDESGILDADEIAELFTLLHKEHGATTTTTSASGSTSAQDSRSNSSPVSPTTTDHERGQQHQHLSDEISHDDIDLLMREVDPENKGINFERILILLASDIRTSSTGAAARDAGLDHKISAAFRKHDPYRTGYISIDQLRNVMLELAGTHMTLEQMNDVCDAAATLRGDGYIHYPSWSALWQSARGESAL